MRYAIPTVALSLTVAAFFAIARGEFAAFGKAQWVLRMAVALPLVVSSIGHFIRTDLFAHSVPPFFPFPAFLVVMTGVFEIAGAVGLLLPATSRWASSSLALLMIAVFPANVYIANERMGGLHMPGVAVRTAIQMIYITLLLLAGWGVPGRADSTVVNNTPT
ncbi:MAG: DoxX family protein [Acidobacteriales bacterium]|nr:DoxX family protein [Terriglobales bacterium]